VNKFWHDNLSLLFLQCHPRFGTDSSVSFVMSAIDGSIYVELVEFSPDDMFDVAADTAPLLTGTTVTVAAPPAGTGVLLMADGAGVAVELP
jgi:hypothetical protein